MTEEVDTSKLMVVGFSLISVEIYDTCGDTLIFKDSAPSSSDAERPLGLIPGKETKESTATLMAALDKAIDSVKKEPLTLSCWELGDLTFWIDVEMSQLDGAMISKVSGLRGAYCSMCVVSVADAHNPQSESNKGSQLIGQLKVLGNFMRI
jgi:hypothetical protein